MKVLSVYLSVILVAVLVLVRVNLLSLSLNSFIVGYLSSIVIVAATAYSFSNMVKEKAHDIIKNFQSINIDTLSKIEDRHMLYDDAEHEDSMQKPEENQDSLKSNAIEVIKSSKASLSIYRLSAYVLMVFGFFYLTNNNLFNPISYIVGLTVPIVIVVATLYIKRSRS